MKIFVCIYFHGRPTPGGGALRLLHRPAIHQFEVLGGNSDRVWRLETTRPCTTEAQFHAVPGND